MADKKITALSEYDAVPAAGDQFVLVDVSDTSQAPTGTTKRMPADRVVATNGTQATVTGGGTIALDGYTVTVPETLTVANNADVVREHHYPFVYPWTVMRSSGSLSPQLPATNSASYTNELGLSGNTYDFNVVFNVSLVPTNATVKLRVRMMVFSASTGSVELRLSNTAVSGSEVTTTSTGGYSIVTSGDIKSALTAGAQTYRLFAKNSAGTYTVVAGAELVVEAP